MSPENEKKRAETTRDEGDETVAPVPEGAPELTDDELEDAAGGATLRLRGTSTLDSAARIDPRKLRTPLRSRTTRRGANDLGFDPGRGP